MAHRLWQAYRGTTAEVATVTPADGELIWETDGHILAVGDGSTAGGLHVMMGDASDYVAKALFDAHTILYATANNTPLALTIAASRIVGRKSSGNIVAMTGAEVLALLTGANLDVGNFDVRGQTLTADALTSGRVIFAGTSGVLSDDADFTFATDTLTVTKIAATTFTGLLTIGLLAAANSHLLISGTAKLNTNEQALYINFPSETVATNGIWITLGSTVTSGDLTGIRSRVTGNATSAGANVRGAYLEAKVGAGKYAAMLEGALIHADYHLGNATISGDVRGLTVQISTGASLTAANLYGILLNIQTRGSESGLSDDVGLLIRNEAVGGNGRMMDSGLTLAGLNLGGSIRAFAVDITFQSGATFYDDGTNLTLAGSKLKVVAPDISGTVTAASALTLPAFTMGGNLAFGSNSITGIITISGATDLSLEGRAVIIRANRTDTGTSILVTTHNAAEADTTRLIMNGSIDVATATWTSVTHTGLVLSGALTLNGQYMAAGSDTALIATTAAVGGLRLQCTNDGTLGAAIYLKQVTSNPANSDRTGLIVFEGSDTGGTINTWGTINMVIADVTEDAEVTGFDWRGVLAGAENILMTLSGAGEAWLDAGLRLDDAGYINTGVVDSDYFTIGAVENTGNTITELARATGAVQPSFDLLLARFGTSVLAADAAHRGMFYLTEGGAGVADLLYCIMKGADNNYSAIQVAIG